MTVNKDICGLMQHKFLDYSVSVITGRSIPDARDGLKPIHRKLLYSMYELGIKSSGATKKCARIIGHTLSFYHAHGRSIMVIMR